MKKAFVLIISLIMVTLFYYETLEAKSRGGSSGGFRSSSSSSRSSSSSSSRSSYSSSSSSSSRSSYSTPSRSTYSTPSHSTYSQPSQQNSYSRPSGSYSGSQAVPYYSGGTTIVPIYGGSPANYSGSSSGGGTVFFILILLVAGGVIFYIVKKRKKKVAGEIEADTEESHLFFIQAGFFYGKGDLDNFLIETSKAVNTGDTFGLLTLLRETSMLIRKNIDSVRWYNYKYSKHTNESSVEAAYNKMVTDERMNVDDEEFTDQNGVEVDRKKDGTNLEEVIVISMAVACHCNLILDDGVNFENFQKIISFFSAIPENSLLGTNVIWNILDRDEMISDCPELRSV